MKNPRRRPLGGLITALFTAIAVAFMVTALLSSPARAQTTGGSTSTNYPIPPSSGTAPQISTTLPATTLKASGKLAFTGADIAGLMVVAAVVIGGGGALVLVSRKRKAEQ